MKLLAVCTENESFYHKIAELSRTADLSLFTLKRFSTPADLLEWDGHSTELITALLEIGNDVGTLKASVQNILRRYPHSQIILHSADRSSYFYAYEVPHFCYINDDDLARFLPQAAVRLLKKMNEQRHPVLVLKYRGKEQLVSQNDILYLRHSARSTYVKMVDGQELITKTDLDAASASLMMPPFWRCHKSYCVNWDHVKAFRRDSYIMDNDEVIAISRSQQEKSKEAFTDYITKCRNNK